MSYLRDEGPRHSLRTVGNVKRLRRRRVRRETASRDQPSCSRGRTSSAPTSTTRRDDQGDDTAVTPSARGIGERGAEPCQRFETRGCNRGDGRNAAGVAIIAISSAPPRGRRRRNELRAGRRPSYGKPVMGMTCDEMSQSVATSNTKRFRPAMASRLEGAGVTARQS